MIGFDAADIGEKLGSAANVAGSISRLRHPNISPNMVGTAITAATNLLTSGIGAVASKRSQERSEAENLKLYKQQRADMRENERNARIYNSPANQMQLYRNAGVNPNAIFSQINSSGDAANVPAATASQPIDYMGAMSQLGSMIGTSIQGYEERSNQLDMLQKEHTQQQLMQSIEHANELDTIRTQFENSLFAQDKELDFKEKELKQNKDLSDADRDAQLKALEEQRRSNKVREYQDRQRLHQEYVLAMKKMADEIMMFHRGRQLTELERAQLDKILKETQNLNMQNLDHATQVISPEMKSIIMTLGSFFLGKSMGKGAVGGASGSFVPNPDVPPVNFHGHKGGRSGQKGTW